MLEALRKAWCFDVLVLSGQLEDMDSLTFIERLNQLPNRPALLLQGDGWYDDHTTSCLKRSRKMFCIEHGHLQDLMRGAFGGPRPELHPDRALLHPTVRAVGHPAAQHQLRISDAGVLQIACSADGKLALRKEILRGVADEYHITVAAVDSGLRRMIDGLETRAPRLGALQGRKTASPG